MSVPITSGTFNAIEMHPIGNGGDNWHVVPAPINFYAKVELSTHFAWGNYYGGTLNAFTINGVNATDMFLDTVYVPISNTNPVIQINLGGNSYSPIPHITYLGLYFSVADLAAAPTSLPGNSSFYLSHIDPSSSIRVFPGGGYYTYTGLTNFTFTISGTPPQEGVESIPEPTSWMLMVGGFGLIGGAMRSRHKAAVTFA